MEKKIHVILMIIANILWIAEAHVVNDINANDITGIYGIASVAIIIGDVMFFVRKNSSLHKTRN